MRPRPNISFSIVKGPKGFPTPEWAKANMVDSGWRLKVAGRTVPLLRTSKTSTWKNIDTSPGGFFIQVSSMTRPFYDASSSVRFERADLLALGALHDVYDLLTGWCPLHRRRMARALRQAFARVHPTGIREGLPRFAAKYLSVKVRRAGFRLTHIQRRKSGLVTLSFSIAMQCGSSLKLCQVQWTRDGNRLLSLQPVSAAPLARILLQEFRQMIDGHNLRTHSMLTRLCINDLRARSITSTLLQAA